MDPWHDKDDRCTSAGNLRPAHLREQLAAGRRAYRRMRYDGDLAADVMTGGYPGPRLWLYAGIGVAIAATITLALWPGRIYLPHSPEPQPLMVQADEGAIGLALPAMPGFPEMREAQVIPERRDALPGVPPGVFALPAIPSLPSWNAMMEIRFEGSSDEEKA